jgi:hypothetical protein
MSSQTIMKKEWICSSRPGKKAALEETEGLAGSSAKL